MYEQLATQGRKKVHTGLAGIDAAKLRSLRNTQLKECFNLIDDMRHKLEFVARIRGISFVDDAASRTTMSTWYALETVEGDVIWIANGARSDDNSAVGYRRLRQLVLNKVKMIVVLGDSSIYREAFGDLVKDIVEADTMCEAVHKAFYSDRENVKILFSPSSENGVSYEEQGDAFKREVNEL
ncbi:MAG: hypothetical protein K6E93_03940 [Bacteroidales bacterium]|nr:hypothetical protein [Bacteroidales bacterium]